METEAQQITDEEIMSRAYKPALNRRILLNMLSEIPTFLVAGHETTRCVLLSFFSNSTPESWHSITMAWVLYSLTQNRDAQTKLREEVLNLSTDNPSMDDLNGLPYLDAVVRETLRLHPPVSAVQREAVKDDCIPLSKPFTDRKGIVRSEIR
jgi:hypothetical protein